MSDARVTFGRLYPTEPTPPEIGKETTFSFNCPKKKGRRCEELIIVGRTTLRHDPQGKNGGTPQWTWNGDRAVPTFSPSINCGACGWHGYIERGRCVNTDRRDEPEPM